MEFWDDYGHEDPKLTYICENLKAGDVEDGLTGCDCVNVCAENCICLARSGAAYRYPERQNLRDYIIEIEDVQKPFYECNSNCRCDALCGNRLVQFGPRRGLGVIDSGGKGSGLATYEIIAKGSFICEYAGEVIRHAEALQRYKTYPEVGINHNYIFCIRESFGSRCRKTYIDPTFYGNIGRYINHSCQPNATLLPIRIEDSVPRLCVFAKVSLDVNTEITFDYGDMSQRDPLGTKECLCQAPNCRKFLPFDARLTDDL